MKTFSDYNIRIPSGASGQVKVICPQCTPHLRKAKNKNSKDLSVDTIKGIWNCHNCGWTGSLGKEEKIYKKPTTVELPLSAKVIAYFKGRGINENTLKFFGITEKMEWMPQDEKEVNCVLFPYIRNKQWVNIKYRTGSKHFKMVKEAELIFFNLDAIKGQNLAVITEGEIDCLSLHECGEFRAVSVPNGASEGNQRLEYLDNCWNNFTDIEEIIIATDNDSPGKALKYELARRLGRERCKEIEYPEGCKDLNEVLLKYGQSKVLETIRNAKPFPVEGVMELKDFENELDYAFKFGFESGVTIGYPEFDKLLNFGVGQLTMVTGVPNSGKSAFLDQMLVHLAMKHHWIIGLCSFEKQPVTKHAANLLSLISGKPFYTANRMNDFEYQASKDMMREYFRWFKLRDEDSSVDGILGRAKQLVKAEGIKALVIDPFNYIEHKREAHQTETEYISMVLTDVCNFAKDFGVHVFLVAHPTKIRKDKVTGDFEVPTLYDIAGSAHFFNKTDNGICVYRDRKTNLVTVYVQKVRDRINGQLGMAEFTYDVYTGRYAEVGEPEQPPPFIPENPRAGITPNYAQHFQQNTLPYEDDNY